MFEGPPLPLSSEHSVLQVVVQAPTHLALGAWVRGCAPGRRVVRIGCCARLVLFSPDLGFLLNRCDRVLLRERDRPVVLEVPVLIQWRALQVATATPFLPGLDRLRLLFPDLQVNRSSLRVPLGSQGPEEVLAGVLESGIQVSESRVVYVTPSG
jgi:hypothetical protein